MRWFKNTAPLRSRLGRIGTFLILLPAMGISVSAQKRLTIVNPALLETEDGLPMRPDEVHQPGEALYLAFQVQGFTVDRSDRVKLNYRIDALDGNGVPFVEPEIGKIDTTLAPQDAKWVPRVRFSPTLPPFADSGKYKLSIHLNDELSKASASHDITFQVRGRTVEPSASLVVRNFAFSREENGAALPVAAYRRGDTLWASFDMTGYKTGDKNRLSVDYGLSVLNAEGKTIYQQPEPAKDESSSFYPRRYVHAVFSLNLDAGVQPGEYTIVLTVRDQIGTQSQEGRHTFTVE